jgi:hypothetical protein
MFCYLWKIFPYWAFWFFLFFCRCAINTIIMKHKLFSYFWRQSYKNTHNTYIFKCTFFFFGGSGIWNRASYLQSRHSTIWTTSPVHFTLIIVEMATLKTFCLGWSWTTILPFQVFSCLGLQMWATKCPAIFKVIYVCPFSLSPSERLFHKFYIMKFFCVLQILWLLKWFFEKQMN